MKQITVFIKTYGCALNQSDSELMAGLLKKADFKVIKSPKKADLMIINTCTVKGPTESKFYKYLKQIKQLNKPIIIAGCIAQTDPKKLRGYSLIGTSQITNIAKIAEETYNNNVIELLAKEQLPRLNLPKKRKNKVIEIIPICEGCVGECAYCKVKQARGELRSYKEEEIINQAKKAIEEGIPEIWLTAQDTGCYGKDINTNLINLLNKIIKIPGSYKIRLGMLNPNHIKEYLNELIKIYKSDKVFKFLHIPVQSGNNQILKAMKRKYTVDEFKEIITRFKKNIPEITIATDIIVGFPGETQEQFNNSLDLIKEIKPSVLNISRFWSRPKTEASKMKKLNGREIKRRSRILTEIFHNISRMQNERWINWQGEVLVDEKGKDQTMIGRNFAYKPVIIHENYKLGDITTIRIRKVTIFDLRT